MMNRRSFLSALASTAAFLALPKSAISASPALHDDAPMLQAMLDRGEPIHNGDYVIRSPLIMRDYGIVESNMFTVHGNAYIDLSQGRGWRFVSNYVKTI